MTLSTQVIGYLDDIIINEEGGWKLTSDPNDNDGGWTFAGVTRKTWEAYQSKVTNTSVTISIEEIKEEIVRDIDLAKRTVYAIYEYEFVKPIQQLCRNGNDTFPTPTILSCAINVGPETAYNIWKSNAGKSFIDNWHGYYFGLIKKNAEAWRDYALYLEWCQSPGNFPKVGNEEKPKTLRAEYINGWYNRVERYRK